MKRFDVSKTELSVITSDLNRARKYLYFLEQEKEKGKESFASVREGLSLAAVVAYGRPFTDCRRAGVKAKKPWIPRGLVQDLPIDSRNIHKKLIKDRNEMWAHTDGNAYDVRNPIITLARSFIPRMSQLIDQVIARLQAT